MVERERALAGMSAAAGALALRSNRAQLYGELLRAAGLGMEEALYPVLSATARIGPARVADIAAAAGIGPTTGSRHLTELERMGLVARGGDPADARVALVELTPAGEKAVRRLRRAQIGIFGELVADWTDAEVAAFAAQLERFVTALAARRG